MQVSTLVKPRSRAAWRGTNTGFPGAYRSGNSSLYFWDRQSDASAFTVGRGDGDNLFTCSLIAVDVDTGKMAWYFQTSPHDMHDWDSAQTPVLVDGMFDGKPRKMALTASRNGYFFVVDPGDRRAPGDQQVRERHELVESKPEQVRWPGAESRRDPAIGAGSNRCSPTAGDAIVIVERCHRIRRRADLFYTAEGERLFDFLSD